jgi:multidrug efflux pump subunit AcrB
VERFKEVDQVSAAGLNDPELQINFLPEKLAGLGVTAADVADTVAAYFRDIAAGKLSVGGEQWLVRLAGTDVAPGYLAQLPLTTAQGEVR